MNRASPCCRRRPSSGREDRGVQPGNRTQHGQVNNLLPSPVWRSAHELCCSPESNRARRFTRALASRDASSSVAPSRGLEPQFAASEAAVLPLDELGMRSRSVDSNHDRSRSKRAILPLDYSGVRDAGVEPAWPVWKTGARTARPISRGPSSRNRTCVTSLKRRVDEPAIGWRDARCPRRESNPRHTA